jgi:hypothetical protein
VHGDIGASDRTTGKDDLLASGNSPLRPVPRGSKLHTTGDHLPIRIPLRRPLNLGHSRIRQNRKIRTRSQRIDIRAARIRPRPVCRIDRTRRDKCAPPASAVRVRARGDTDPVERGCPVANDRNDVAWVRVLQRAGSTVGGEVVLDAPSSLDLVRGLCEVFGFLHGFEEGSPGPCGGGGLVGKELGPGIDFEGGGSDEVETIDGGRSVECEARLERYLCDLRTRQVSCLVATVVVCRLVWPGVRWYTASHSPCPTARSSTRCQGCLQDVYYVIN